ncbi:MAG: hypothetical protein V3U84_04610 [Thiotrichaceae bacterium]
MHDEEFIQTAQKILEKNGISTELCIDGKSLVGSSYTYFTRENLMKIASGIIELNKKAEGQKILDLIDLVYAANEDTLKQWIHEKWPHGVGLYD